VISILDRNEGEEFFMLYVYLALAGWVGGGWAVTLGTGTGGYPNPDDTGPWPWPPCLACGGILGALAAVILEAVLPRVAANLAVPEGWGELTLFGLVVGGAAGLAYNVGSRALRGKAAPAAR
jgi:hypothetical protein